MTPLTTLGGLLTMLAVAYLAIGALDEVSRRYRPEQSDGPLAVGALFDIGYWLALVAILMATTRVYGVLPVAGKAVATVLTVAGAVYAGYRWTRVAR